MRRAIDAIASVGLAGLLGLASLEPSEARETITFEPPRREAPQVAEPPVDDLRLELRAIWSMTAEGDWPARLEGEATARIMGDLVEITFFPDGEESPLFFSVWAEPDSLSHVTFSQTSHPPRAVAALGARHGANYLTPAGRTIPSLSGNAGEPGSLLNHEGFARVDRRGGGLVVRLVVDAVYCEDITEPPFISRHPCDGPSLISSRPAGTARVTGCIASLDSLAANPDACLTPFQIDHITPHHQRQNIAFDDPGLTVTFSEPVRIDTLEKAASLFTISPGFEPLQITGGWEETAASRYRFTPEESLYSGTTYIVQIQGGEDGVRSRDGSVLEDNWFVSTFATMLDLVAQAPGDAPPPLRDEPVRLHNFQVVRDASLTAGKPTLTRAYFDWRKHEEVAADMQPDRFRMEIETSAAYQRRFGQRDRAVGDVMWIYRSDDDVFSAEDRRHARHTANFFGWRPSRGENSLRWVVRPYDPYPHAVAQTEHEVENEIAVWDFDPPPMELYYTFARVGSWRDGVPASFRDFAARAMHATAVEMPSFFPHREARARMLPPLPVLRSRNLLYDEDGNPVDSAGDPVDMSAPGEGAGSGLEALRDRYAEALQEALCAMAADRMPPPRSETDIRVAAHSSLLANQIDRFMQDWADVHRQAAHADSMAPPSAVSVVFVPEDFLGLGVAGLALGMGLYQQDEFRGSNAGQTFGFEHMRSYISMLPVGVPIDMDKHVQVHLHEIGHEFGLEHVPGDARGPTDCPEGGNVLASDIRNRMEPIEAWRMASDGLSGWNKSQTEGNAQGEDENGTPLVSMMWPWAISRNAMSLHDFEYRRLQRSTEVGPATYWEERRSGSLIDAPYWPLQRLAQSALTQSDAVAVSESLVVAGKISEEGLGLEISAISRMVDRWPGPPASNYHAELRDANGRLLARAPLGFLAPIDPVTERSANDPMGWPRFRVVLPVLDEAVELVIKEGERVRARLAAPSEPVAVRDARLVTEPGGAMRAEWTPQGPAWWTEVAYSPDGEAPWRALGYGDPEPFLQIDLGQLTPGPAPTLRITARSGLAFVDEFVSLDGVFGLVRPRR